MGRSDWFRTTGDGGWSWLVVASAFAIQVMGGGSHYAQGVYVSLFLDEFKESKSKTAFVGSIFGACLMMSAPLSAMCAEKFGNRKTAFGATILATLGLILSGFANSIVYLYITFSVMTGLGLGISYMPGIKAVGDHFVEKRAIAMGLACAGVGMGSFLFPPIVNSLIQSMGLKGTLITHGVVTFVSLGLSSLGLISCERTSQKRNLVEDDPEKGPEQGVVMEGARPQGKSLWYDSRFTLLCANQVFGWLACIIVIMDLAPYGKTEIGLEAHHASMLLSTSGALNVLGRIVGGFLIVACKRFFSALSYYTALNVMLVISTFAIPFVNSYPGLLTLSGFFGLGLSCYSAVLADMVADMFGKDAIAFSFGYFVLFQGVGALIGAPLSGLLHDATHTYKYSFGLAGFFYVIGVILLMIVRVRDEIVRRKRAIMLHPTNALLSAKTITSIISSSVSLARQNAANNNQQTAEGSNADQMVKVPSAILLAAGAGSTRKKEVSSSSSTEFEPSLLPIWVAGGDEGERIEVPKMELIQVHAEKDAVGSRTSLAMQSDTALNIENLRESASSADLRHNNSFVSRNNMSAHASHSSLLWSNRNLVAVNSFDDNDEDPSEDEDDDDDVNCEGIPLTMRSSTSSLAVAPSRSRKVSMMSSAAEDPIPEEPPLTAQEVYAAEDVPMLAPEKAPAPAAGDESAAVSNDGGDEAELTSLAPDEIEQLLEPSEDFSIPGSSTMTPLPPALSPHPPGSAASCYAGSPAPQFQLDAACWPGSAEDETARTPVPEMVIVNNWANPASGRTSLSSSVPSRGEGWILKQEDLSAALRRQQEKDEAAEGWEAERAPLLSDDSTPAPPAQPAVSTNSKRASVIVVNEQGQRQWRMSEDPARGGGDDDDDDDDDYAGEADDEVGSCKLKYLPLSSGGGGGAGGGDDPVSESSDDSMWLGSNQSTIQSCISEADMDLRSLNRLGIDVKKSLGKN